VLRSVVVVERRREIDGKVTDETRFYISSLASAVGPMIRAHQAIENCLHWVMDMVFRNDECRYNPTRNAPGKDSIRLRRENAGWDDGYLASLAAHRDDTSLPATSSLPCGLIGTLYWIKLRVQTLAP